MFLHIMFLPARYKSGSLNQQDSLVPLFSKQWPKTGSIVFEVQNKLSPLRSCEEDSRLLSPYTSIDGHTYHQDLELLLYYTEVMYLGIGMLMDLGDAVHAVVSSILPSGAR